MTNKKLLAFSFLPIILITFVIAAGNSPPEIKSFFIPEELGPDYSMPFTTGEGFGVYHIAAVVEDKDGKSNLLKGSNLRPRSSLYLEIASPSKDVKRPVLSCDSFSCSDSTLKSHCTDPSKQIVYVCFGVLLPSDPSSNSALDELWTVKAIAVDLDGRSSKIVESGQKGFNIPADNYIQVNEPYYALSPKPETSTVAIVVITALSLAILILIAAMVKVAKKRN
ncbi:hypothetical protein FJZ21_01860 [Candidatus Pacearchaeota archaeon]|nr:hypothetical protein [Candidatus Pacearchaeota archaeon]